MARLALVFDILDNAHGVDIRQRRNLRRMSRYTEKAFAMNDAEFKKCYRVGKELFEGKPAAAPMSTGEAIPPDIDLPPQYMRAPLSEEEIDLINGGGIA
ncbi:Uncharacterized protein OBRU01_09044 [Operophtera brumata]|uniref:Uncharacterized protein n=1 Tax=Operophtera brumata TaxID=104452 RepID=A0A0L7KYY3_OPEBR|nr:Uncharacterized protein OBRU01_09044 [Operophtera brumata]